MASFLLCGQIIQIFADAQAAQGGAAYVRDHLAQLPDVVRTTGQVGGRGKQDLDTTLRHLVDHNCRLLLQSHFEEGASRDWILHMIELGQKSRELFLMGKLLTTLPCRCTANRDHPFPRTATNAGRSVVECRVGYRHVYRRHL